MTSPKTGDFGFVVRCAARRAGAGGVALLVEAQGNGDLGIDEDEAHQRRTRSEISLRALAGGSSGFGRDLLVEAK